jgi:hypothetical protein
MRITYLHTALSVFVLMICFSNLQAQERFTPGSDTLMFDGGDNIYRNINIAGKCQFKVTYVEGKVTGTTTRLVRIETCGVSYVNETGIFELKQDEMVMGTIKTGENSKIEMMAPDGTIIRLGSNSETEVECNTTFEEHSQRITMKLLLGSLWSKVTHALGGEAMQVRTSRGVAGVRGTIFTYEAKIENGTYTDVLRTLEGSVDFWGNPERKIDKEELQRKTKLLEEDFKAGKITLEEFTNKIQELNNPVRNTIEEYHVTVEAGNESYIRDNEPPTVPARVVETGTEWYLDKNFGK